MLPHEHLIHNHCVLFIGPLGIGWDPRCNPFYFTFLVSFFFLFYLFSFFLPFFQEISSHLDACKMLQNLSNTNTNMNATITSRKLLLYFMLPSSYFGKEETDIKSSEIWCFNLFINKWNLYRQAMPRTFCYIWKDLNNRNIWNSSTIINQINFPLFWLMSCNFVFSYLILCHVICCESI